MQDLRDIVMERESTAMRLLFRMENESFARHSLEEAKRLLKEHEMPHF